jgi:hypothetical protein
MFGLAGRWSADFRAFSRGDWDARTCFRGVLHHAARYLGDQRQIVMSLDDTGLPKRSRMLFGAPVHANPQMGPSPSSENFHRRPMLLESGPEDGSGLPGRTRGDAADPS